MTSQGCQPCLCDNNGSAISQCNSVGVCMCRVSIFKPHTQALDWKQPGGDHCFNLAIITRMRWQWSPGSIQFTESLGTRLTVFMMHKLCKRLLCLDSSLHVTNYYHLTQHMYYQWGTGYWPHSLFLPNQFSRLVYILVVWSSLATLLHKSQYAYDSS